MSTNTTEALMVAAHKAGIAAFGDGNASVSMAHILATKLYPAAHEREAFIAGYIGAMRRYHNHN